MRQKNFNKISRYFLLALVLVIIILLGYLRDQYILDLFNGGQPLLIKRNLSELAVIPLEKGGNAIDPRWITLPVYLLLYVALSSALVYLLFLRKEGMILVVASYCILLCLTGTLLLAYLLLNKNPLFYTLAQQLKEFMLSPFLPLLVTAIYYGALQKEG